MHLVAIAVRSQTSCPQCLEDTVARSIAEKARCSSCNAMARMDWWRDQTLMAINVSQLLCWPEGESFDETVDDGFRIRTRRVKTACACGEPFDPVALSAASAHGVFTCSACKAATPLRVPPAAVHAVYPALKFVVERFSAAPDRVKTHALRCDACGAALAPAEGASRVRCDYCNAVNLIVEPDGRSHPAPYLMLIDADDPFLAGFSMNGHHLLR
jgi:LSD1 subclass zinc finger protein